MPSFPTMQGFSVDPTLLQQAAKNVSTPIPEKSATDHFLEQKQIQQKNSQEDQKLEIDRATLELGIEKLKQDKLEWLKPNDTSKLQVDLIRRIRGSANPDERAALISQHIGVPVEDIEITQTEGGDWSVFSNGKPIVTYDDRLAAISGDTTMGNAYVTSMSAESKATAAEIAIERTKEVDLFRADLEVATLKDKSKALGFSPENREKILDRLSEIEDFNKSSNFEASLNAVEIAIADYQDNNKSASFAEAVEAVTKTVKLNKGGWFEPTTAQVAYPTGTTAAGRTWTKR